MLWRIVLLGDVMLVSMDVYMVRVKEVRKKKDLPLGLFDGKNSLIDVLESYLSKLSSKHHNIDEIKRSIRVQGPNKAGQALRGVFWVGQYGFTGDIIDAATGSVSYQKKPTDSDPFPYYFEFRLPPKEDRGILVAQRNGLIGIKGLIDAFATAVFDKNHPSYRLSITPLIPQDILREYVEKGRIDEITLVKHEIAPDIADQFGSNGKGQVGTVEISIKPKAKGFFKKDGIIEVLDGTRQADTLYKFYDIPYDTVKATVTVDGRARTFDLVKPKRLRSSVDISKDVQAGANGHPDYNSLVLTADSLITGFANKAGIVL